MAIVGTRTRGLLLAALLVAVLMYPLGVSEFLVNVANLVALATLGALGLNLLIGVAGQMAIGSAAFLAVGAYTAVIFGAEMGLPFLVVLPLSAASAAAVGAVVGIPALRLRGLYLLIATLALHFVVLYVVTRYQSAKAGEVGFAFPPANVFGRQIDTPTEWYFVLTAFSAGAAIVVTNLLRSRFGRAWLAIRERDIAAEIIGINVTRTKISAFMVSAALTGLQGALFAYYLRLVTTASFGFDVAVQYVAMIIIGGLGSVLGSYLGAAFVVAIPFVLTTLAGHVPSDGVVGRLLTNNIFELQTAVYGAALIAFLLLEPRGLVHLWVRFTTYLRLWPFQKERVMNNG
jgi:branched-chain amino acid transport system permease protein